MCCCVCARVQSRVGANKKRLPSQFFPTTNTAVYRRFALFEHTKLECESAWRRNGFWVCSILANYSTVHTNNLINFILQIFSLIQLLSNFTPNLHTIALLCTEIDFDWFLGVKLLSVSLDYSWPVHKKHLFACIKLAVFHWSPFVGTLLISFNEFWNLFQDLKCSRFWNNVEMRNSRLV